eukprot:scaffold555_cov158-Skeletonema_menzelii.AAC.14
MATLDFTTKPLALIRGVQDGIFEVILSPTLLYLPPNNLLLRVKSKPKPCSLLTAMKILSDQSTCVADIMLHC